MIPASRPLSVVDQVSVPACFDTSEVRDVVVLLQHGQSGGIQVKRQARTATCWCRRVLATTSNTTTPFRTTRIVHGEGGWVPGPGGGVLNSTHKGWRQRERIGITGSAAGSTAKEYLRPWMSNQITRNTLSQWIKWRYQVSLKLSFCNLPWKNRKYHKS